MFCAVVVVAASNIYPYISDSERQRDEQTLWEIYISVCCCCCMFFLPVHVRCKLMSNKMPSCSTILIVSISAFRCLSERRKNLRIYLPCALRIERMVNVKCWHGSFKRQSCIRNVGICAAFGRILKFLVNLLVCVCKFRIEMWIYGDFHT